MIMYEMKWSSYRLNGIDKQQLFAKNDNPRELRLFKSCCDTYLYMLYVVNCNWVAKACLSLLQWTIEGITMENREYKAFSICHMRVS